MQISEPMQVLWPLDEGTTLPDILRKPLNNHLRKPLNNQLPKHVPTTKGNPTDACMMHANIHRAYMPCTDLPLLVFLFFFLTFPDYLKSVLFATHCLLHAKCWE